MKIVVLSRFDRNMENCNNYVPDANRKKRVWITKRRISWLMMIRVLTYCKINVGQTLDYTTDERDMDINNRWVLNQIFRVWSKFSVTNLICFCQNSKFFSKFHIFVKHPPWKILIKFLSEFLIFSQISVTFQNFVLNIFAKNPIFC